jgi:hypothetical protein
MPFPNRPELFVLLFKHGNSAGPWTGSKFCEMCPYTGLFDNAIYCDLKSDNIPLDQADVRYYLENSTWCNDIDGSVSNGHTEDNVDEDRLERGSALFKRIFEKVICPSFKKSELGQDLWDWIRTIRSQRQFGFYKFAKFKSYSQHFSDSSRSAFTILLTDQLFGDNTYAAEMTPEEYIVDFCHGVHSRLNDAEKKSITRKRSKLVKLVEEAKDAIESE